MDESATARFRGYSHLRKEFAEVNMRSRSRKTTPSPSG
jgi:hypothetical protein